MKYILEKNGKREIVEKKKHSKNYYISAVLKWLFCIGILALTLLLCQFLDKKLNDGRIVNKIINSGLSVSSTEKTENTENIAVTEEATEQDVLTVCLDPGHGGMDPGCDYNGRIESEDNWALALAVKQEMESKGIEVIMTRNDNDTKVFFERQGSDR